VDLIDLGENRFATLPVDEILRADYPDVELIASMDHGDYLQDIFAGGMLGQDEEIVLTFNKLTEDKRFVKLMRTALQRLERVYGHPVDVEFAVEPLEEAPSRHYLLHVLQCRPLSQRLDVLNVSIPEDIPRQDIVLESLWVVPDGKAENIRYAIYIDPSVYLQETDPITRRELGRAVSRLNQRLAEEPYILLGPGRWGSVNLDLGIHVSYSDIYNTKVLVEIGLSTAGARPDLSHGTHFFNDLVESGILALGLWPDEEHSHIDWNFFRKSPNSLAKLVPEDADLAPYLRVIDIPAVSGGRLLQIYMDGDEEKAVAYLGDPLAKE
jgi:hypothetical protein